VPDPIRVALVGCGFQGRYHAANIAAHGRAELAVCCDIDEALATAVGDRHSAAATTDYQAVLDDATIDAVVIATTTNTHAPLAIAAAAHGKHVLLEKPMALDVTECLAIEEAVATAGITMMIGYKFRFMQSAIAARHAVPEPLVLTAHTLYDYTQDTSSWVNDRSLSGGRVTSSMVHSVDLLRFLAGAEVTAVTAIGGNLAIEGLNDLDNVVATLQFDNGAVASLVHGTAGESDLLSVWSFQTAGRGVNATIHQHGRRVVIHDSSTDHPATATVDKIDDPFAAGMMELLDAFLEAIAAGGPASAGPRDGTMALLICQAIEAAVATGRSQHIESLPA